MTTPGKAITNKWLRRQVWAVAFFGASLSFQALMEAAQKAGVHPLLSPAMPLALDGLIVVAIQAALTPIYSSGTKAFAWFAVVLGLSATMWANHDAHPHHPVVAFSPPVAFVLTAILASLMAHPKQPEPAPAPQPAPRPQRKPAPQAPQAAPQPKPTPKPQPQANTEPKTETPGQQASSNPKSKGATQLMREVWDKAIADGKRTDDELPSPKELAEAGGCNESHARRTRKKWLVELQQQTPEPTQQTHEPALKVISNGR